MAFIAANYEFANGAAYGTFGTTSSVAIVKGAAVAFGASSDLVTGTSDANLNIGVAQNAVASASAGATTLCTVRLFGSGIVYMIGNGTVTRGKKAVHTGTAGKVTDAGSTPDARTVVGIFLDSNSTDGDLVPVLIP